PPYASGTNMPSSPSSPIFLVVASGNSCVWSIVAAIGRISASANSRTISRMARCSSLRSNDHPVAAGVVTLTGANLSWETPARARSGGRVLVEPAAALPAQVAPLHHPPQQRAGTVLRVAEPLVQHLHDVQAGVEADEIGERERPHRVVHAQ